MYEHPYLSQQVTEFERRELARAVERRRFLAEHADQIVPRQAGRLRRIVGRMLRGSAASRESARDAVAGRRATPCEPASAR
ncbi:hypothetical protein [Microbacterium sp. 1.5R]|uniref:hypothetical protein n=1 Tax=Microbacterium sp. 1.5R TaxID=1916917 RepID=UPI0011A8E0CA|nr:hypothetical protein [Microbacterium sp. 1.5R]